MFMKGGSKYLIFDYFLEIRNDLVYFYLFYFGVVYNVFYGGGKGLNFSVFLLEYILIYSKKGNVKIILKVWNEEDNYFYNIIIYFNGSSNI